MKTWYTITAKGEAQAEISIFGPIGNTWDGEGVTAKKFIEDFKALKAANVTLTVNSPGGSLFDGLAIYTAMAASGKQITAKVMGLAASAASLVVMAAQKISMPKNTHLMIHKASNIAWGTADDMREMATVMDSLDKSIALTYAARTGKSEEEVTALLAQGDVWMTADEAVEAGFADEATELVKATAEFDLANLPANVRAAFEAAQPPAPALTPAPAAAGPLAEQIQALAAAAGVEAFAGVIALDPSVVDQATAAAAVAAARDIKAYAALANQAERADPLIRARKTVAEARVILASNMARVDEREYVDTTPPTPKTTAPEVFNPTAVWKSIEAVKARSYA